MYKIPVYLAALLALGATPVAFAASVPSSTDEARATAASLPRDCPQPQPASAEVPSTTDEARAVAEAALDAAPVSVPDERRPAIASTTDEARAGAVAAADEGTPALACVAPLGNGDRS